MKFNSFLALFVLFLLSFSSQAQTTIRCSTDEKAEFAYPDYEAFQKEIDKGLLEFNQSKLLQKSSSAIITIPVHVIIVHNPGEAIGTGNNLSMARIQSQIDVLTEDFRRLNTDASNTPSVFAAGDTEIEFCLAVVDPNGNPTDGVTRYATTSNMNSNENAIKSATGWNRNTYLNMWSAPNLGGLLGWAYLPSTTGLPNATLDGIVCATGSFGGPGFGTNNPYHLGRTCTHEVGHYLGLRHIWRNNGCGADDGFTDTPLQDDENYGCPNHPSPTCSNGGDMFMNYMDYVNDNCMNAFTEDQGAYMQLILNTSRSSLLTAANYACNAIAPLEIDLVSSENIDCFGDMTGSILVEAEGGTSPYQFSINNGGYQSSGLFENLAAGTYTLTVQDADDNTASMSVTVTSNTELTTQITQTINNLCAGEFAGAVFIDIMGGVQPYYVNGQQVNGSSYAITNQPAGMFVANVTDALNCQTVLQYTITEPEALAFFTTNIEHVACNSDTNGSITYEVSGGTPSYQVSVNGEIVTSSTLTELAAGSYTFDIIDDNNCFTSSIVEVTEPDNLSALANITQHEICLGASNGEVVIQPMGGTGPFIYSLDNGAFGMENSFDDLSSGSHAVVIRDDHDCLYQVIFDIDAGYEPTILIAKISNIMCGSSELGSISVLGNNGAAPYQYTLLATSETNNTGLFENLAAGSYEIELSDANGCNSTINVVVTEEASMTLEVSSQTDVICFGKASGSVDVQTENSEGAVEYSLDGINFQSSANFVFLEAGNYTIYANDESGCTAQINVVIGTNPELSFDFSSLNPNCFMSSDGEIAIQANGGQSDYNYRIGAETNETGIFTELPAGIYDIDVIDALGCIVDTNVVLEEILPLVIENITVDSTSCFGAMDGNAEFYTLNGQGNISYIVLNADSEEVDPSQLEAGVYTVHAIDENLCQSSDFTFSIPDALPIEWIITEQTDANCDGSVRGTASFMATTGEAPYTYSVGQNSNSTGIFDNFNAGTYQLIIMDATGCERIDQFTIGQLEAFSYEISAIDDVDCFGASNGMVQLNASGPDSFVFRLESEENNSGLFENLSGGTYAIEIEDENSCIVYDTITIIEPSDILFAIADEVVNANDLTDITLFAEGGVEPYQYKLDDGPYQDSPLFIDVLNGDYSFMVVDQNGCTKTIEQSITEVQDLENQHDFRLYPNPYYTNLTIDFADNFLEDFQLTIKSIDGKVLHHQIFSHNMEAKIHVDLTDLPTGLHIIELRASDQIFSKKIIKITP